MDEQTKEKVTAAETVNPQMQTQAQVQMQAQAPVQSQKQKKTEKKKSIGNLISILVCGGLFIAAVLIASFTGIFYDVKSALETVFVWDKYVIFRLIIMLTFMLLLANLILLVLRQIRSKQGRVNTLVTLFDSLVRYVTAIICACWGLSIIGVNVSTIFASVGIVALIIGFGAESLIADVVSGIFILFEKQYNVGDIIEIDGFRGVVTRIGIRTMNLRDTGGNEKIINNSAVKNVLNRSDYQSKSVCDIGIPYEADLDHVKTIMNEILPRIQETHRDVFIGSLKYVGVEQLGDSSVILRVVADVNENNIYNGRRILNEELKTRLEKAGISVPYPQLDIHQ